MHLKRYSGASVPDVMRQIREELGPEAVILHTRTQAARGMLRFVGGRAVEILAAVDAPGRVGMAGPSGGPPVGREQAAVPREESGAPRDLHAEVAELRRLIVRLGGERLVDPAQGSLLARLATAGLEPDLALRLAAAIPDEAVDDQERVACLAMALGSAVRVAPLPLAPRTARVAVIGPPGSGKTASVAKLAAHTHLRGGAVHLLSATAGSLGAPDPLAVFARILGVPYRPIRAPEMAARSVRGAPSGLTLLDTPGEGTRGPDAFAAAAGLARAAGCTEVHLVAAADGQAPDLRRTVRAGAAAGATHLLLTRVDETDALGTALGVAAEAGLPLSYLGTGREVPDDIEPVSVEALARRLLGVEAAASGPIRTLPGAPLRRPERVR
jgi:flagellar biosynthesis protein FlhF